MEKGNICNVSVERERNACLKVSERREKGTTVVHIVHCAYDDMWYVCSVYIALFHYYGERFDYMNGKQSSKEMAN